MWKIYEFKMYAPCFNAVSLNELADGLPVVVVAHGAEEPHPAVVQIPVEPREHAARVESASSQRQGLLRLSKTGDA